MLKGKFWTQHLYNADDGAAGSGDVGAGDDGGSAASGGGDRDGLPSSIDDAHKLITALQKRVGDRDETLSTLKGRLDALENAQRQTLEKSGNYEQLYKETQGQLESLRPKVEGYDELEGVIRDSNKQMIEALPEAMRDVVPEGLSPAALNRWLHKSRPLLARPTAPDIGAGVGAGGAGGAKVTLSAEQKAMAKAMRMSEDEYAKQLQKRRDA